MIPRPHAVLAAALTIPLVLGLGACGDDDDGDDAADTEATDESEAADTTTEPEADAEDTGAEGGEATDDAAAGDAVATVFDSSIPFDDKVSMIEGGEAHRADHDGYVTAADAVGGITLDPTDVAVTGDTATVTYRVLFGGNEAYADQTIDVTRVEGNWVVPTDAFCGFLASARTPCAGAG
jgi:iron complex transport system substrate-binding protein